MLYTASQQNLSELLSMYNTLTTVKYQRQHIPTPKSYFTHKMNILINFVKYPYVTI